MLLLIRILTLSCFIFFSILVNAQTSENRTSKEQIERSQKAIRKIKEGTIVVVLPSNANKIKELTKIVKSNNISKNQKLRLKNELFETVARTDRQNKYLLDFFIEHYDFSNLRFVYDTSIVEIKNGVTKDVFVNKNLLIDEKIELNSSIGGFIRIGRANQQGTGILSLLVCDRDNKVLDSPFPYNIVIPNDTNVKSEQENFEQIIEKTNNRLKFYYEKVDLYGG